MNHIAHEGRNQKEGFLCITIDSHALKFLLSNESPSVFRRFPSFGDFLLLLLGRLDLDLVKAFAVDAHYGAYGQECFRIY